MQAWLDDMIGPKAYHVSHPSRRCAMPSPEQGRRACVRACAMHARTELSPQLVSHFAPHCSLSQLAVWGGRKLRTKCSAVACFGRMHEQHSFVRTIKQFGKDTPTFKGLLLSEKELPNGKIWYNYWHRTNKSTAYIMHCNWVKMNKKSRLIRDGMWFLDQDDQVCRSGFDPMAEDCQRNCVPVNDGCRLLQRCSYRGCESQTKLAKHRLLTSRKYAALDTWHPMSQRLAGCEAPV